MSRSFLSTKLYVPPLRPALVPRPRLLERLNAGLDRRPGVTLVSAPAGSGKTTLLSEWLTQIKDHHPDRSCQAAWLSLDEGDNDPTRFWACFIAALQTVEPGLGEAAQAALHRPGPECAGNEAEWTESVVTSLANAVAEIASSLVLVLDDYHVIHTQVVHSALSFLLDHLPPQLHLVIAGRADPPLPLARLRAGNRLAELRAADLRFTTAEAAAFLNQAMGLGLSMEDIAALEARTEGWIVGLQLAALSLQRHHDIPGFIRAFAGSHHYILDYLVEEVLVRQPAAVQEYLLQTAILDRLTGSLCDAITGRSDGQTMLEHLERNNLFITPLDNQRCWYRYHQLFAQLLYSQLSRTHPEQIPPLHRRAAEWCERHDLMEDAVHHALQAEDYDLATRLIEQVAFSLWRSSKARTLLSWMRSMPEELVRSRASLSLHYAAALIVTGQLEAAEPWLDSVEARGREREASPRIEVVLTHARRLRAYVARFTRDIAAALALSRQATESTPLEQTEMVGVSLLHLGHAHFLDGNTEAADATLTRACTICHGTGHVAAYLSATHYLAQLRALQGQLRRAMVLYEQAQRFVAAQGEPVFAGIEHAGLGEILCERNEMERAAYHVQEGLRLAESGGDFVFLRDGYLARAGLAQARGDLDEALAFVEKAGHVVRRHRSPWETALLEAWRARLWLQQGRLAAAAHWADTCGLAPGDMPSFLHEFGHLTLARVLLAQGRLDEVCALTERLLRAAESAGRMGRALEMLVWQALAREARGDRAGALLALERALVLGEAEGYTRTFVEAGARLVPLLRRAVARGVAPGYASRLIAALGESAAGQPLTEPLTARELEVLRLVAAGCSNNEIADHLVLAVGTVKRHLSNIYSKLDVHRRTRMVSRARELNLL